MPSQVASRCGHCGAGLRPDAPWCTLCLTRTGAQPDPAPRPAPPPAQPEPSGPDPLTAPLEQLLQTTGELAPQQDLPPQQDLSPQQSGAGREVSWPCAGCDSPNPLDASVCASCGAGFLESVRLSEPPLLTLPVVGDLARLDKAQLLVLALAVAVVVVLLTLVAGLALG